MRATYLAFAALLVSSLLLLSDYSTAQSVYGQMWGRLTNASGTPVSGATVTLTSVQTGASAKTKSDASGNFSLSNLSPDLYQIEVQADGFRTARGTSAVSADSTTTVNSSLQAGDPKVMADRVISEGSILKLDRTDVSTVFDARTIEELPVLDRNLTRLELLVPGATPGKLFIPADQNPQNGIPVNINGQHFSGSAFQLDGTENRDPLEGIAVINPTLDSVEEMKVTTQGYNAEFGQATAGVVTIQTKTGSNSWHGDAFGFRRTGFGESTDPFAPAGVPPSKHNIFGGSFGGPIARNKLFVFGDYQGTRSSEGANVLLSVPPDHVRTTCLGSAAGNGVLCNLSDYSKFINGQLQDQNGNPFPNYQIPNHKGTTATPVNHVTDQAVAILALLPAANHTPTDPGCTPGTGKEAVCNNYLASGKEAFRGDESDVRIDYNASSLLRLFARYSFGQFHDNGPPAFGPTVGGPGADVSGFAGVARTTNQGISSGFTYALSSKFLTDFRFGYFKYRLDVNSQDSGQTPNLGIPGIFVGQTGVSNPYATGMPDFDIPGQQIGNAAGLFPGGDYLRLGYSTAARANSCNCPLREREQQFQFVNNWTHSTGRHVTKWGADLRYLQNYRLASDLPQTGSFVFAPNTTGLGLASFLVGVVSPFTRAISTPAAVHAGEHQKRFGFYGQDTWRVNSRFTLNYGLRWEIYFPQTVNGVGGFLRPDVTNHDTSTTFFNVTPSALNNTAGGISGKLSNFAPRIGMAYLINSSSVIRAGYGRSFDAGYAGDIFGIAPTQDPPVAAQQNIQGTFNLAVGPPPFNTLPSSPRFSLLDLAIANDGTPTTPASGAVLYALPSHVRVPTVDSWNLTFQHELTSSLYFEVGYVGNKGTFGFPDSNTGTYYNLNQANLRNLILQTIKDGTPTIPNFDYRDCRGGNPAGTQGGIFTYGSGTTEQRYCLHVPKFREFYNIVPGKFNPNNFEVRYFGNNANDNYHSLQAKVQKNFTRGYSFLAQYTWSKGLDYDVNYFAVDRHVGYGPDSFDVRHRFVMTNIWDLPIGRGKAWLGGIGPAAERFVGGWTIGAITVWRSGLPFTPSYVRTTCANDLDPGSPCRPNLVGPVHIAGSREQYFSTTGGAALPGSDCVSKQTFCGVDPNGQPIAGPAVGPWQRPGAGQIGNVGRNSFTGPGFFESDIALAKLVRLSEHTALRFRADAFNAFNKVNLGNPDSCVDCLGGGSISSLTSGATQRRLQFSLEIEF